jgi:hypothetical protein
VEVGVDEPVVEVLYKGEAALRVPEVVLHVGQVDDGIEVVHQLHAEFIGLDGKVKYSARQRNFCIVRWKQGIRQIDNASEVMETLELLWWGLDNIKPLILLQPRSPGYPSIGVGPERQGILGEEESLNVDQPREARGVLRCG